MEKCDNVYFWVECGNRIIFHTIYPEKIWEDFIKSKSDLPGTVLGDIYDHLSRNHAGIKFSDCSACHIVFKSKSKEFICENLASNNLQWEETVAKQDVTDNRFFTANNYRDVL